MQAIGEGYDGKTIDLAVGQVVELRLKENPTTGFAWRVRSDGAPSCRIAADFVEAAPGPPVPGRGGTHVWRIEGAQVGHCDLALAYGRGWESGRPAETFAVRINVTA